MPYQRGGFSPDHRRGWDGDRDHDRDHHRRSYWGWGGYGYGYGYPYLYSGLIYAGELNPWLSGPDDYGYGYSGYADNGGYAGNGNDVPAPYANYGQQPDDSGNPYPPEYRQQPYPSDDQENQQEIPQRQSSGRPAYNGQGVIPGRMSEPAREDAVTVIFKDGRPAEQIHNYLLTSSTLTVLDAQRRQISLDDVNLEATVAANRAAGEEFRVPRSAN